MATHERTDVEELVKVQDSTARDLLGLVRRGLLPALIVASIAAGLTYYISGRLEPRYRATASLLISEVRPSNAFGVTLLTAPVLAPSAYAAAMHTSAVMNTALQTLTDQDIDVGSSQVLVDGTFMDVEDDNPSTILRVSAEHGSPAIAAALANALSEAIMEWDIARARSNVETMISALESSIAALDAQILRAQNEFPVDQLTIGMLRDRRADTTVSLETAHALSSSAVGYVESLDRAREPGAPYFPRVMMSTVLAFGAGIALAYFVFVLMSTLNTKLRDANGVTEALSLPVLAQFEKVKGRRLPNESTNFLRANVLSALVDAHPKIILVASARAKEGKTSVSIGLAESLARADYRTLLIDADLRRSSVSSEYDVPGIGGQRIESLLRDPDQEILPSVVRVSGNDLHLLFGHGRDLNAAELLATGFPRLLEKLKERYDAIVIDSAPVLPVADSLSIAPYVTTAVLVTRMAATDRRDATLAMNLLHRQGTHILGAVTTWAKRSTVGGYGFGYGYGYGR